MHADAEVSVYSNPSTGSLGQKSTVEPLTPFAGGTPPPGALYEGIVTSSVEMRKVIRTVEKVASAHATVLILGESGTGKELIASALHRRSGRKGKLVPVNCGAIPEDILESELFGHERGSFTGAISSKIGRFQLADGGTIFLDEIGEMSPKLQVKLLRVLQERRIDPVGSIKSIDVDVRVVAATNKNLAEEVRAGRFRDDLFYRLQVVPIELPPLRARGDDVLVLTKWFVTKHCKAMGRRAYNVTSALLAALRRYEWPGNVRELENLIERMVVLADEDTLDVRDLPASMQGSSGSEANVEQSIEEEQEHSHGEFHTVGSGTKDRELDGQVASARKTFTEFIELSELPLGGVDFNGLVSNFENTLITLALNRTNWNKKAAAELLQLNRTTLVEKIRKRGLEPEDGISVDHE